MSAPSCNRIEHLSGRWIIVDCEGRRVGRRFATQHDAIERAKEILARSGGGDLEIFARDGSSTAPILHVRSDDKRHVMRNAGWRLLARVRSESVRNARFVAGESVMPVLIAWTLCLIASAEGLDARVPHPGVEIFMAWFGGLVALLKSDQLQLARYDGVMSLGLWVSLPISAAAVAIVQLNEVEAFLGPYVGLFAWTVMLSLASFVAVAFLSSHYSGSADLARSTNESLRRSR